jgi:Bacterial regulatory proteins, luxR family
VIARTCDITEATVKVHMKSILRKSRVGNRTRPNSQPCTRALYDATDGLPQQWRMLEELDGAVARGWMIVEAGHSIRLTDAGRRLMESQA